MLEALKSLHKVTHQEDRGCLQYDLHKDSAKENTYVFIETWESAALLDEHINKEHFKAFQAALEGKVESMSIQKLEKFYRNNYGKPNNQTIKNRKSIRQFTGEPVREEDLELIFKTAQRAPTSINAQQISLVYTKDKAKLKQISELCGGQAHIATADVFVGIVIDFNRTNTIVQSVGKNM